MNQVLFPNLGEKITGLLEDLMSYMNYMLEFRGNAKDQVDAIHEAVNYCSVFFYLTLLEKLVFKRRLTEKEFSRVFQIFIIQ